MKENEANVENNQNGGETVKFQNKPWELYFSKALF